MTRTRSSKSALLSILAASPRPMYVVDDRRKIVYCNAACSAWTGAADEALIGQRCDYHSGEQSPGLARVAAGLCPPPEAFSGIRTAGSVFAARESAPASGRRAEFIPLAGDQGDCAGVLVVVDERDTPPAGPRPENHDDLSPQRLHEQLQRLQREMSERYGLDQLVGEAPAMRRARKQITLAMSQPVRALITGPPGSGREHAARTIHYGGKRRQASTLVPLSCALLDVELLKGVVDDVKSAARQAEESEAPALMLLDADQLSAQAQGELTELLDVEMPSLRTIATSRQPLTFLAEAGDFRAELALSLSTLVIELPPLSQRVDDIPLLAQFLLEKLNASGGRQLGGFAPEALDELVQYDWPENADELAELVGQACRNAEGPLVTAADLPKKFRHSADAAAHPAREEETIVLDDFLREVETELITRALQRAKGNKSQAARMLGVNRARLLRRIAHLGLE